MFDVLENSKSTQTNNLDLEMAEQYLGRRSIIWWLAKRKLEGNNSNNLSTKIKRRRKMSSREMSMDTIMEDEDSFVSNTNAIIYASSDISGWTHSLISDNNIPNSSSSTSVDDRQQQISTAGDGGGGDDSMIVSSGHFATPLVVYCRILVGQ
ncbi:hypothetical protein RDI58_025152 [Solanum bulbocastanum]|uniref:Uncharacterized protein n=1 Tax=Solanum bulbocastanum TaxID=147425 RepID=A0AAN8Y400_SOLBU